MLQRDLSCLPVLGAALAVADLLSIESVIVALRKKPETISRIGLVLGVIGLLLGLRLCYYIYWLFHLDLFSASFAAPLLLSVLGVILSLRKSGVWPSILAALLTFLVSPVFARHGCGLSSWPLEMSIGFVCAIGAFLSVSKMRSKWLAWLLAGVFVVASCFVTGTYLDVLHSAAFPEALLDESGRAWRASPTTMAANVAFTIAGLQPRYVLDIYGEISGKKVKMTDEIEASNLRVFAVYTGKNRDEAFKRLEHALFIQARIELVLQEDNSLLARGVVENKQSTSPAVTPPAGQEARQP